MRSPPAAASLAATSPVAPALIATFLLAASLALPGSIAHADTGANFRKERAARIEAGLRPAITVHGRRALTFQLHERMRRYRVPGMSIAVIEARRLEWAGAYGTSSANGTDAVTAMTLFQAASLSKPVAALGALRLIEQGRLALDEPVNAYLLNWKLPDNAFTAKAPVTVRRLLSHSAGLTVSGFEGYAADAPLPTLPQVLEGAAPANSAPVRVDQVPGTAWRYAGGGYVLLQQLLSDVTHRPFAPLMRDLVLGPLQMRASVFEQPLAPEQVKLAALGHTSDGAELPGGWHIYPELAAAGLWATPSDLARFALAVMPDTRGARSTSHLGRAAAALLTAQTGLAARGGEMGLGLFLQGEGRSRRFSHSGVNAGYRAYLVGFPATGQGAVIMTNADSGMELIREVLRSVAAEYRWPERFERELTPAKLDPQTLTTLVGRYELSGAPVSILVTLRIGQLRAQTAYAQGRVEPAVELLPQAADHFVSIEDGTAVRFVRGADGQATTLIAELPSGAVITAARRPERERPASPATLHDLRAP